MKKVMLMIWTAMLVLTISACSAGTDNSKGITEGNNGGASLAGNRNAGGAGEVKTDQQPADQSSSSSEQSGGLGAPSTTEKKTVVFSTFFPSDYFIEAKKKYEAIHPNITIELRSIETDDAHLEENLEKFVKQTGTAMLSGQGPDLIEMDQLPSDDYVKRKLLANLGDIMDHDPEFKKEQYFTNILEGIKVNGGMYGLPIGFFIYALMGNEDAIKESGVTFDDSKWNWEQFITTAQAILKGADKDHQSALGRSMPEYMTTQLVNERYATFINLEQKSANFVSEDFTNLLQLVKTLFDKKVVDPTARFPLFYNTQINSPKDYIQELRKSEFSTGGNAYTSKLYLSPNVDPQHPGGTFRTYQTIGLNERSTVKAEAWDFLKFLLSDEMQSKPDGTGFPLNKASYAKKAQALVQQGAIQSDQLIGPMKGKSFKITQQDIDDLDKFLNGATYSLQFKPSKIDEIITEEAQAFFTGQKSADEVAKLIQNRVTTILNE